MTEQLIHREGIGMQKEVTDTWPSNDGNPKSGIALEKEKDRLAKAWFEIDSRLPKSLNPHHRKLVRHYFRAQLRLARGKKVKAASIFRSLDSKPDFRDFEDQNQSLLAAVDVAVRGFTNRRDEEGGLIEPLFTIKGS